MTDQRSLNFTAGEIIRFMLPESALALPPKKCCPPKKRRSYTVVI
jgi:hypothetical protein